MQASNIKYNLHNVKDINQTTSVTTWFLSAIDNRLYEKEPLERIIYCNRFKNNTNLTT